MDLKSLETLNTKFEICCNFEIFETLQIFFLPWILKARNP